MQKILINASNLHNGGGVQVATSVVYELIDYLGGDFNRISFYLSSEVSFNLKLLGIDVLSFSNIEIFDVHGLHALNKKISRKFYNFDLVFTLFGPLYLRKKIPNHIIGFAQSWIINPNNDARKSFGVIDRVKLRLKFAIQWLFFKYHANILVVELPHVKSKLVSHKKFPSEKIRIVENCFSSIYNNRSQWVPLRVMPLKDRDVIRIGYVARAYPHKNLNVLYPVARILRDISKFNFEFYVTLDDSEWSGFSEDYRGVVKNVGALSVSQCPSFYQEMDGVIFASLLECFSATPLEAMVMRKPLFASDRGFVRDVCGDYAIYIDPLNPLDIAKKIDRWYSEKSLADQATHVDSAHRHVMSLPNSRQRAIGYMDAINDLRA